MYLDSVAYNSFCSSDTRDLASRQLIYSSKEAWIYMGMWIHTPMYTTWIYKQYYTAQTKTWQLQANIAAEKLDGSTKLNR